MGNAGGGAGTNGGGGGGGGWFGGNGGDGDSSKIAWVPAHLQMNRFYSDGVSTETETNHRYAYGSYR